MSLDSTDFKILEQLDLNPKLPATQLAKKLRLSQQVVDYRIKKLIEEKIISSFSTIINLSKLGYEQYKLLFTLANVDEQTKQKIIGYLKSHKQVYWSAIIGGKWDLFVAVFVKNYEELERFLDDLFNKFPKALKDYEALYSIEREFHKHKFLHKSVYENFIKLNLASAEKLLPDNLDLNILHSIKSNCRLSSLEIGRKTNVTYKTIQNRTKLLEQNNIIAGYRLFLNSQSFGYKPYLLLISFQSYGRDVEKKLFSYARTHKSITQSTKLFGRWSVLFHIRVKDEKELQGIIIEMRNTYPIIGDYEIIPIFEDIAVNQFPAE